MKKLLIINDEIDDIHPKIDIEKMKKFDHMCHEVLHLYNINDEMILCILIPPFSSDPPPILATT